MSDKSNRLEKIRNNFVFFGFGLSGAAALIYEVVWTRSLSTVMGSSTYAVSTMLAAFMAGLSVGAALGAYLSPRIRKPYLAFAWCEFGIDFHSLHQYFISATGKQLAIRRLSSNRQKTHLNNPSNLTAPHLVVSIA